MELRVVEKLLVKRPLVETVCLSRDERRDIVNLVFTIKDT